MAGGRAALSWAVGDGREGRRWPAHRVLRSARTALEIACFRPVRKDIEPFGVAAAAKKSLCLYSMLFTDPFTDTGADSLSMGIFYKATVRLTDSVKTWHCQRKMVMF